MPGICQVIRRTVEQVRGNLRDEGHILDPYNSSFLKVFFMFAMGRRWLVVRGCKAKRVEGMAPGGFRCLRVLVFLKITIGVVTVILSALGIIEGLREILRLGFRKRSEKHLKDVIGWTTVGKSWKGLRSLKYGTVFKTWLLAYSALGLQMVPEESLRENRIIFVSANFPEDMESFNASRRGSV